MPGSPDQVDVTLTVEPATLDFGTVTLGTTAVFLDPPYAESERTADLYAIDDGSVSAAVRAWALAVVSPIQLRIVAQLHRLRESALALLPGGGKGLAQRIAQLREAIRKKTRA